jgi:hypothetical protein
MRLILGSGATKKGSAGALASASHRPVLLSVSKARTALAIEQIDQNSNQFKQFFLDFALTTYKKA